MIGRYNISETKYDRNGPAFELLRLIAIPELSLTYGGVNWEYGRYLRLATELEIDRYYFRELRDS